MSDKSIPRQSFDLAVIGAGPGGYPAAIKAAQQGLSVALIEAQEVGGTCLNRGCIPSKTLIAGAEAFRHAKNAQIFGIEMGSVKIDYSKLAFRKDLVVTQMRRSLEGLIASNGIQVFKGYGRFTSPREIKVSGTPSHIIQAEKTIIATGSEPRQITAFPCDGKCIHDSTTLLKLTKLPKSLTIIGGGVIGCEFASLFNELGVEVTIIEVLPTILSTECKEIVEAVTKSFQKRQIKILTGVQVESLKVEGDQVEIKIKEKESLKAEMALIAVGRKLNTTDVGLDKAGVLVDEAGFIVVNDKMETNVEGIYAVGDITSRWWLAHVATHQGVIAALNAADKTAHMHYNAIPNVIFTHPEAASVGLSLDKAREKGYDAALGAFPFQVLGKSQALNETEGFAQIVIERKTGQILGAQVVGFEASTLVAELVVAITNELTIECLQDTIHAHPTLPEAWMEAAFLSTGTPLHWPPAKKR